MSSTVTPTDPYGVLSPRELAVLQLAVRGMNNRQMGARLGIRITTVACYVDRIFQKLGATNRVEAGYLLGIADGKKKVNEDTP